MSKFSALLLALLFLTTTAHAQRFTLSGIVTLSDGAPAGDAQLWFAQESGVVRATAAKDGAYRIEVKDAGAYQLVALLDGHALAGETGFLVGDDQRDLVLPVAEPVTVQVIGPTSAPLSGARLTWLNVNGAFNVPVAVLNEAEFPALRSDAGGKLVLPFLPTGGFVRLRITHFEHADLMVDYLPVRQEQPALQMLTGQRIAGRVLSPDKKGVEGGRISVFQSGTNTQREFATAITDPEGYFHCRVPRGTYSVAVRHVDYASPAPVSLSVEGDEDAQAILEMQVARRIKGNIEMPDGKPCGGAYVAYLKGDTLYEETYTGADGAFQLRVASPDGVLRVSPPSGYATEQFSDIPVAMEAATEITLRPIRLREIPRLKGRVLDAEGQPVVNAIITTPKLPDPARFLSGEEGRFEFVPSYLPEGGVVLFLAEHPERFEKVSFLAEFGTAQDIEVRLEKYEPQPAAIAADAAGLPRPLLGEPAPDWTVAKWFNSDPLTVKGLGGKVIVAAFWGSFDDSPQGVDALQTMALLGQAYANDDSVEVVGIHDATSTEQEVQAFIEHTGLAFPVGLDSQRFETFTAYKVTYIPEIVLIDKKGKVRFRQSGEGLVENLKLLRRE